MGMMGRWRFRWAMWGFIVILSACGSSTSPLDSQFLAIARSYLSYGRVDDQNRWAPGLCAFYPSEARLSASNDDHTHGGKIYFVLARDRGAYVRRPALMQPEGQVIVKEAWEPKEVAKSEETLKSRHDAAGSYVPGLERGGKYYTTGNKLGLFIMLKEGSRWQYGTVTADGAKVTQSGNIPSCVGCHQDAKPDRLFGLPSH